MKQNVLVAIVEMVRAILEVLTMTEMVGTMLMVAALVEVHAKQNTPHSVSHKCHQWIWYPMLMMNHYSDDERDNDNDVNLGELRVRPRHLDVHLYHLCLLHAP